MRPLEHEVQRMLRLSRQDLDILRLILDAPHIEIPGLCFHAQQCVEKALKAMLAFHDVVYPHTHNLATLADTLGDLGHPTPVDPDVLLLLNPCAVSFRYDDTEIPTFTRQEVMTIAQQIFDWANAEANRGG